MDKTSMLYWFPKILAAGLPVPKTILVENTIGGQEDGRPKGDAELVWDVAEAAEKIGFPCFLRTSHTSGKHSWRDTCLAAERSELAQHMWNLVEFSELACFLGIPRDGWAVRELLPVTKWGMCPHYNDMPLVPEVRFFVRDGKVECWHPYWPKQSVAEGGLDMDDTTYAEFIGFDPERIAELAILAEKAGVAVGGDYWSIDFLESKDRGWFLIDMAEGAKSWHWPDCECSFNS